jgi:2-keto-4-pentenoate hydratase/2-oxohepta-3-ene-1,7-dioic acid hydratase in catechol pathway
MKLLRHGNVGNERPGIQLEDGQRLDLSSKIADYDEAFFGSGSGLERLQALLKEGGLPILPEGVRLGPPVARPSKIICVGLNYRDHAKESGAEAPKEPVLFFKSTTALCGPFDPVLNPRGASKLDWEVELAIVIGRKAAWVEEGRVAEHIAGYALHNDYSEREFQLERGGQWVKGKSCDTFAPLGPWLVTPDEIADVNRLGLWLKVNGEFRQQGNTAEMIFKPHFLVSYISRFMTLLPGDVISTGTPAGVGLGMKPPSYLKVGDVVELGGDGLGSSKQLVGQAEGPQAPTVPTKWA